MPNQIQALKNWLMTTLNIQDPELQPVCGDASFRKYYRLQLTNRSVIVADSPPQNQKNHEFVHYARLLAQAGLLVPQVIAVDFDKGFLCLSDLGDKLLLEKLDNHSISHWYQKALLELPKLHSIDAKAAKLPKFDAEFIKQENRIFTQWLLGTHLNFTVNEQQQQVIDEAFEQLINNSLAQPQVPMHRDFHSRNLMLVENNEIACIDFQDMVLGPITYDAVSLLRDCYCRWDDKTIDTLKQHYYQLIKLNDVTMPEFNTWFDLTGMQRHIKAAGIFARLMHRDGKTAYLKDIPRTLDYIIDVAAHYPQLNEFAQLIKEVKQAVINKEQQMLEENPA